MRNITVKALAVLLVTTVSMFADQAIIDPSDDAEIYQDNPNYCYGDETYLSIGYDSGYLSTLIEFDLTPYSGVTVDTASIRLFVYYHNGEYSNLKIGRNIADWSEDTVTWNNRPGFVDYISIPYVPPAGWWEIDVTGFVQDFVDGTYNNYGFRIGKGDSDSGYVCMSSKEYSNEEEHPYLELNYDPDSVESSSLGNIKAAFK